MGGSGADVGIAGGHEADAHDNHRENNTYQWRGLEVVSVSQLPYVQKSTKTYHTANDTQYPTAGVEHCDVYHQISNIECA